MFYYEYRHKCNPIICNLRNKLGINDANNDLITLFITVTVIKILNYLHITS
jgi:hypothetical protein